MKEMNLTNCLLLGIAPIPCDNNFFCILLLFNMVVCTCMHAKKKSNTSNQPPISNSNAILSETQTQSDQGDLLISNLNPIDHINKLEVFLICIFPGMHFFFLWDV